MGQPDSGDVLAADLYALLEVAKDDLPSVSELFNTALTGLRSASTSLGPPMHRPDCFWGSTSPVQQPLLDLMTTVDGFVAGTTTALDDAGHALAIAVDRYADTDDQARQSLANKRLHNEPHPT